VTNTYVVVGLGFGDEGKGHIVNYLCQKLPERKLVVRFNGGAQAAHNVVLDDETHHTFRQFGSGSLQPNVDTYMTEHCIFDPSMYLFERDEIRAITKHEYPAIFSIHPGALVATPYHKLYWQALEDHRSIESERHGSCGMGIGAVMDDHLNNDLRVFVADLLKGHHYLREIVREIRRRKIHQLEESDIIPDVRHEYIEKMLNWDLFGTVEDFKLAAKDVYVQDYRFLAEAPFSYIFEGAQGFWLDEKYGFSPFTTWSNTTAGNAFDAMSKSDVEFHTHTVGVTRTYLTRHGPGPLPTEVSSRPRHSTDHNRDDGPQGAMRFGNLDIHLLKRAARLNRVDSLAITHCDAQVYTICVGEERDRENHDSMDDLIYSIQDHLQTAGSLFSYGQTPYDIYRSTAEDIIA